MSQEETVPYQNAVNHSLVFESKSLTVAILNDHIKGLHPEDLSREARKIMRYFTQLATKYNCPVIIIIHQNPGGLKERGHFGSHLQRSCYALLTITKKYETSTLSPKALRKAGVTKLPHLDFKFDEGKGYHTSADNAQNKHKKLTEIAKIAFAPPAALRHTDAVKAISNTTTLKERAAINMIATMVKMVIITKGKDDLYRMNTQVV